MNKLKISILAIILIGGLALAITSLKKDNDKEIVIGNEESANENTESLGTEKGLNNQATSTTRALSKDLWTTFSDYLYYAKNHNIEGIKLLSYQLSATCKDQAKQKECFALMDNVYGSSVSFKKEEFTEKWADAKQAILLSPFIEEGDDYAIGSTRKVIYFIYDSNGYPKILGINPIKGSFIKKKKGLTAEQNTEVLAKMNMDTDKDGLENDEETCANATEEIKCIKTDPNKRDSDGDSWWDGIEILFK